MIKVYTNEIFNSELLVCVSSSVKQIKQWANKNSTNLKEMFKNKDNLKILEENIKKQNGFVIYFTKEKKRYLILWLEHFNNTWDDLDVLNHELVHYKQFLFEDKKIDGIEFEAYFIESTFRSIRRMLKK